jgi:SAM-dependent methyltransferase
MVQGNTAFEIHQKNNALALDKADRNIIAAIGRRLHSVGLFELLAAYGNEKERTSAIQFDVPLLPPKLQSAVELFVLGHSVDLSRVRPWLSNDAIDILGELGVVCINDEEISCSNLLLTHHYGALLFREKPSVAAKLYYGNDSLALGRLLQWSRGKVLDLCAGVGAQTLLCARSARSVIAVDIEPAVRSVFNINLALNGLDGRAELRIGNLFEPVDGEQFDHICCNPPLVPVPKNVPFPSTGDGGTDGLSVVRRVLAGLPQLLKKGGRCHIVGMLLGDGNGPYTQDIRELAVAGNLDVLMILPRREPVCDHSLLLNALVQTSLLFESSDPASLIDRYVEHFRSECATYVYFYLMRAQRANTPGSSGVFLTSHFLRGVDFWTV